VRIANSHQPLPTFFGLNPKEQEVKSKSPVKIKDPQLV